MSSASNNKGSSIRTYGDPVLAAMADEITNIDGKLITLAEDMFRVMYQAPGLGLAGPQIERLLSHLVNGCTTKGVSQFLVCM
jgi:peptide deformylase